MINEIIPLVSVDTCDMIHEYMAMHYSGENVEDTNVPGAAIEAYQDFHTQFLLHSLKPKIEEHYGKNLLPTYSFFRTYKEGQALYKHRDRDECEISVTICMKTNADYVWPIYIDGKPYGLNPGEGIIYKGEEQLHWREPLGFVEFENKDIKVVRKEFWHSQVFLHYVEAGGKYDTRPYEH